MGPRDLRGALRRALFVFAPFAALATGASAQSLSFQDSIPLTVTNWTDGVSVPRFDPALGILRGVRFHVMGATGGNASFESIDEGPTTVRLTFSGRITLQRPDASPLVIVFPTQEFEEAVTAYDDELDFAGSSGRTFSDLSARAMGAILSEDPADLALFIGAPGDPGSIDLPVRAAGISYCTGAGNLICQFAQSAGARVTVTYLYGLDCDDDGVADEDELAGGSADCDGNGVPDECQPDCDGDGTPDACSEDCDGDGLPDACEVDCDEDGTPDDCQEILDCNGNGTPDSCDVQGGGDENQNGTPDDCEDDCDMDGVPDGEEPDCDADGTPDDCQAFRDCNQDGVPDGCQVEGNDCDMNGVPDECQADCNANGVADRCERMRDCNQNGTPDECEADCDQDGLPDECELDCDGNGTPDECEADCDQDGLPDGCESDCDGNGIPDECEEDCDGDGAPDTCENDCDGDGLPDDCESDCDGDGVPDDCDVDTERRAWRAERAPMEAPYGVTEGRHAFWLPQLGGEFVFADESGRYFENPDGTAELDGVIVALDDPNLMFETHVLFSHKVQPGDLAYPPQDSPKLELAEGAYVASSGPIDPGQWHYYLFTSGTLMGLGDYQGAVVSLGRMGPAFQVGEGASGKNMRFGGSGWLTVQVLEQPDQGVLPTESLVGDINVDLEPDEDSGGICADEFQSDQFAMTLPGLEWHYTFVQRGRFEYMANGAARLTGCLESSLHPDRRWFAVLVFEDLLLPGDESYPPPMSPKLEMDPSVYVENGGPIDPAQFSYYTKMHGVLYGLDAFDGAALEVHRRGPAFQFGAGANNKNYAFGASGWVTVRVLAQPSSGAIFFADEEVEGDMNLVIDDCQGCPEPDQGSDG